MKGSRHLRVTKKHSSKKVMLNKLYLRNKRRRSRSLKIRQKRLWRLRRLSNLKR